MDLADYVLVKGVRSIACVADIVLENGLVKDSLGIKANDVPQPGAICHVELASTFGQLMDKVLAVLRVSGLWTAQEIDTSFDAWTFHDAVMLACQAFII